MDYVAMIVGYVFIGLGAASSLSWLLLRFIEMIVKHCGMWAIMVRVMVEMANRRNGRQA